MTESLVILGASVRAAAQSAARAGLRPICGDMFCDADLPSSALGQVAHHFPCDLSAIAEAAPRSAWMFTGGLENYPTLVERISRRHTLWGTAAGNLKRVRDPLELGRVLAAAGLRFPECRAAHDGLATDGSWLLKHRRSSGGMKVGEWRGGTAPHDRGWYYQRRIAGAAHAAVFVASGGRASLLGITWQLFSSSVDRPFQYAGSIGPVTLPPGQQSAVCQLGAALAAEFELRGLFGVDFVADGEDIWAIEVNPRYTASVEVLERSLGFNAIEAQREACQKLRLPSPVASSSVVSGKQVCYAERPLQIEAALSEALLDQRGTGLWPAVADIPRPGASIAAGQPVLTVFAQGGDPATVQTLLWTQVQAIQTLFQNWA